MLADGGCAREEEGAVDAILAVRENRPQMIDADARGGYNGADK